MNNRIKSILFIVMLGSSINAFAQLTKGTIIGSFSFGYSNATTTAAYNPSTSLTKADSVPIPNSTSLSISAGISVGYFVMDNLAVGVVFNYNKSITPANALGFNNEYYSWNNVYYFITPGIFATKYFKITDKFYLSAALGASYSAGNAMYYYLYDIKNTSHPTPVVYAEPTEPTTTYSLALSPGFNFFPTANWAIAFRFSNLINYVSTTSKNITEEINLSNTSTSFVTENRTTNTLSIAATFAPTLSVSYLFIKKQTDKPSSN